MGTWLEDLLARSNDPLAPTTPTRVIGTSFQPSLTGWTLCSYVVQQVATAGQDGTVALAIGAADPPTTPFTSGRLASTGGGTHRSQLIALVPPGFFVKLTATGNTTNTIVEQIEIITS